MTRLLASHLHLINQILAAYRAGWFPMADPSTNSVEWVQPRRRAVIPLDRADALKIPRSLRAKVRQARFRITTDSAFEQVIRACAAPSRLPGRDSTWLDPAIIDAFLLLHRAGHAHSLEVWALGTAALRAASIRPSGTGFQPVSTPSTSSSSSSPPSFSPTLVGGLYGLALGSAFMGESMFCLPDHGGTDASKVALIHLFHHLRRRGFTILDSQIQNPHMQRLGAIEITRATYLKRLAIAADQPRDWLPFTPDQTIAAF